MPTSKPSPFDLGALAVAAELGSLLRRAAGSGTGKRAALTTQLSERIEALEADGSLRPSLANDFRAELALLAARSQLARHDVGEATIELDAALEAAEAGTGDILLWGHLCEAQAQLAALRDGCIEGDRQLSRAIEAYREAEQRPELPSALFRSAAWRLEAGDRGLALGRVREALGAIHLFFLVDKDGEMSALEGEVLEHLATPRRREGLAGALQFAFEMELAAADGIEESRRRRLQGEAWAVASLVARELGTPSPMLEAILARPELLLKRDTSPSAERVRSVGTTLGLMRATEGAGPSDAERDTVWAAAVFAAWSEEGRHVNDLWSRSALDLDSEASGLVFAGFDGVKEGSSHRRPRPRRCPHPQSTS